MKQNIVDVIAYLLEMTSVKSFEDSDNSCDEYFIQEKLEDAGFSRDVVESTFDWLRELIEQKSWCSSLDIDSSDIDNANRTFRLFSLEEQAYISMEIRNFILSLEQAGILDTKAREVVISQLMQLNQEMIELSDAKWVVLLVLMSDSNRNTQNMRSYLLATMSLEV